MCVHKQGDGTHTHNATVLSLYCNLRANSKLHTYQNSSGCCLSAVVSSGDVSGWWMLLLLLQQ